MVFRPLIKGWVGELYSDVTQQLFLDSNVYKHFYHIIISDDICRKVKNGKDEIGLLNGFRHAQPMTERFNNESYVLSEETNWLKEMERAGLS